MEQRFDLHIVYYGSFHTVGHSEFFKWPQFGVPVVKCGLVVTANSALGKFSIRIISGWEDWLSQPQVVAKSTFLGLCRCAPKPCWSPLDWEFQALDETFGQASRGQFQETDSAELESSGRIRLSTS